MKTRPNKDLTVKVMKKYQVTTVKYKHSSL